MEEMVEITWTSRVYLEWVARGGGGVTIFHNLNYSVILFFFKFKGEVFLLDKILDYFIPLDFSLYCDSGIAG